MNRRGQKVGVLAILVIAAAWNIDAAGDPAASARRARGPFRAAADSMKFTFAIDDGERRGEAPRDRPTDVKSACVRLLEALRKDGRGLTPESERNIESYFTVADAFEADGLLQQSVDYLTDLQHKLGDLVAARAGRPSPSSLIATEDDILHFRDAHNIHAMDGRYMAGAQPTEKGYRWLRSKGVTTVINLRVPSEHERKIVEGLGMRYVHIPWADEHAPSMEQVETMLQAVGDSGGRVFQHCLRGIGRDMTMAAAYMIANHGESAESFIERGRREAPRWESDQKRDPRTGERVQFKLLREFERLWRERRRGAARSTPGR
jgi:protein tyrosine phosphatase (PTP) superfamily phosphohydrolase (DUF442 family)